MSSFNSILRKNYEKQISDDLQRSGRMSDISDLMKDKNFFPQDPDNDANLIYINPASRDNLWEDYKSDLDFRKAINTFYFDVGSHSIYQQRIPDLIKVADRHGEFWNLEIIGDPGSGKSTWVRGYVIPTHSIITARDFIVHCDIDGLENNFPVDMKAVMSDLPDIDISRIPKFYEKPPFDSYVTYDNSQTNRTTKFFKRGDVSFQDESPVQHGKGSRTSVDNLENILKVAARALGLNFAFISPVLIPIETVHYYCRIIGYVRSQMITVMCLQSRKGYVGLAEFQAINIPGLTEYYERVSREKKKELQDLMGYSSYKPSESEIKELVKELVEAVEKAMDADGVEKVSRDFVKAIAGKFDKIRSSIDKDDIIARAYRRVQGGGSGDDPDDSTPSLPSPPVEFEQQKTPGQATTNTEYPQFDVTNEMIIEIVKPFTQKNPIHVKYYLAALGRKFDDVAVTMKVSESAVSQSWTRINTMVEQKLGNKYEPVYCDWLSKQPHVVKVTHNGKPSEWDVMAEMDDGWINVISVKFRNPRFDARKQFNINEKEIMPEFIQARILEQDGKKARVILHVKAFGKTKTQDEVIDIKTHKKSFTFKKEDFE